MLLRFKYNEKVNNRHMKLFSTGKLNGIMIAPTARKMIEMKRVILIISTLFILIISLNSCSQEKVDKRNLKGEWQRITAGFGGPSRIDTVCFDRKYFYEDNSKYKYYLDDSYIVLQNVNNDNLGKLQYDFISDKELFLEREFNNGDGFRLFKLD